ncbi:hypothetical protein LJY25_14580 [Hymenobacter sp. BT175]|uniref:hypothetical protein n=1 Tax=Hymenobacter translucens TaxID=2886507 RepID=UPI001D0DDB25|nr:hypothetical protein [Hymenobacter translucens]MCC2547678.1 hypothetical protein [Hymenobacter translucens]
MPKPLKSPEEKAVFRYRVEVARPKLPQWPAVRVSTMRPDIDPEDVRNVLRRPPRRYDDDILNELEKLAVSQPAA